MNGRERLLACLQVNNAHETIIQNAMTNQIIPSIDYFQHVFSLLETILIHEHNRRGILRSCTMGERERERQRQRGIVPWCFG